MAQGSVAKRLVYINDESVIKYVDLSLGTVKHKLLF